MAGSDGAVKLSGRISCISKVQDVLPAVIKGRLLAVHVLCVATDVP